MSANMRRTTWPLPWRGSRRTTAPAAAGDLDGAVGRIVVVDVDRGVRQRGAEIGHDLADRRLLVVAGHQHGDPVLPDDLGRSLAALSSVGNIGSLPPAVRLRNRICRIYGTAHLPA